MGRGVKIVGLNLGDEENKDAGCRPADSTHNPRGKKNEVNRGMEPVQASLQMPRVVTGRGREGKEKETKARSNTNTKSWEQNGSKQQTRKGEGKRQNKRDRVTRRRTKDQLRRCPAVSAEVDRCKGDKDKKGCNRTPCVLGSVSAQPRQKHTLLTKAFPSA
jgi:hypothetical protein